MSFSHCSDQSGYWDCVTHCTLPFTCSPLRFTKYPFITILMQIRLISEYSGKIWHRVFFWYLCLFVIKSLLKIEAVVCAVKFFVCTYIDCVRAISRRLWSMKWRLPHGLLIVDNQINTRWMLLRSGFACPCDCGCEACWPKVCEWCAWVTEVCGTVC